MHEIVDFRTPDTWPNLSEFEAGMDQNSPDATSALAGRTIALHYENGRVAEYQLGERELSWTVRSGEPPRPGWGPYSAPYVATEFAPELFYVLSRDDRAGAPKFVISVLDLAAGIATTIFGEVTSTEGRGSLEVHFEHAGIGSPSERRHERTGVMDGKRTLWRYSDTHLYEHIYVNAGTFGWHAVTGPEQGAAEIVPFRAYQIREDIILMWFREGYWTLTASGLMDLSDMRLAISGWGWDFRGRKPRGALTLLGARGVLLGEVTYPQV
ncbi:MAG: hypothetical protein BGO95_07120 [Micrococcales bacterium 73-13]|nr:MAG: hypothetical protein BGO95_07120 [Micrococcales bacterium 73-13]